MREVVQDPHNASMSYGYPQGNQISSLHSNWSNAPAAAAEQDLVQQFAQAIHALPVEQVYGNHSVPPNVPHNATTNIDKDLDRILFVLEHKKTYVSHLTEMSRALGIGTSGLKKAKLERLVTLARKYHSLGQFQELNFLRQVVDVEGPAELRPLDMAFSPPVRVSQPQLAQSRHGQRLGTRRGTAAPDQNSQTPSDLSGWSSASPAPGVNPLVAPYENRRFVPRLSFRLSPFYQLDKMIGSPTFFLQPHVKRRPTQFVSFDCDLEFLENKTSGVFLVCQEFNPQAGDQQPIYFPFYNELELDGETLGANTRGIRGVVGSARPVDLKPILLKRRGRHKLRITVVVNDQGERVSDKSFAFAIYYGQKVPHEVLVEQIKARPHIDLKQTKSMAMKAAAGDEGDDVVVSSDAIYSLKDSIMMTRISVPIRSRACTHIETFDALTFIMLQDQAETWKCPVCNRTITWESLAVDDFFAEILSKAGPEVESVAIKADGTWSVEETDSACDDETDSDEDHRTAVKRSRSEMEGEIVDLLSETDDELLSLSNSAPPPPQPAQSQQPASQPAQSGLARSQSPNETSAQEHQLHEQDGERSMESTATFDLPTNPERLLRSLEDPNTSAQDSAEKSPPNTDIARQEIYETMQAFRGSNSVMFDAPQRFLDEYRNPRTPNSQSTRPLDSQPNVQTEAPCSTSEPVMYPNSHTRYANLALNNSDAPIQPASGHRTTGAEDSSPGAAESQDQVNGHQSNGPGSQSMKIRLPALSRFIDDDEDDEDDIIDLTMD